jgi:hypothetical protein
VAGTASWVAPLLRDGSGCTETDGRKGGVASVTYALSSKLATLLDRSVNTCTVCAMLSMTSNTPTALAPTTWNVRPNRKTMNATEI